MTWAARRREILAPVPTASSAASPSMSLVTNPSHLEAADPVNCSARPARSDDRERPGAAHRLAAMLLHGDAAFARPGHRCGSASAFRHPRLQYRRLPALHHQQPIKLRQAAIPCLLALSVRTSPKERQAPIFHQRRSRSGHLRLQIAIEIRQKFHRDRDRRNGAIAASAITGATSLRSQPLMYKAIRRHPPVSVIYSAQADRRGRDRPGLCRQARPAVQPAARRRVRSEPAQQGGLVRRRTVGLRRAIPDHRSLPASDCSTGARFPPTSRSQNLGVKHPKKRSAEMGSDEQR